MKKAEENMVDYLREKEDNKTKLKLIAIIGVISILTFITILVFGIMYTDEIIKTHKIILILIATVIFAIGILTIIIGTWKCGYYKCLNCEETFAPTFFNYTLTINMVNRRYMKCQCCGKINWCEKVLTKSDK